MSKFKPILSDGFSIVLALAGCQSNVPPPTPTAAVSVVINASPTVTATRPRPTVTVTSVPQTPTPSVVVPTYSGFSTVQVLPNDFLLSGVPEANILQSLSWGGGAGGGGGDEGCLTPAIEVVNTSVYLDCYPASPNLQLNLEVRRPDHTVLEFQQKLSDFGRSLTGLFYCPDRHHFIQAGAYTLTATIGSQVTISTFFQDFARPVVFTGQSGEVSPDGPVTGCGSHLIEAGSNEIFFAGFEPRQTVTVWVYRINPEFGFRYDLLTYWSAQMDEQGRLVQYIPELELPTSLEGQLVIVVGTPEAMAAVVNAHGNESSPEVDLAFYGVKGIEAILPVGIELALSNTNMTALTSEKFPHLSPLIHIPAGEFQMGTAPGTDDYGEKIEQPLHTVLVSDFWMEKYEVSNIQYQACVGAEACTPPQAVSSKTRPDYYTNLYYADYPVIQVTHAQAQAYCAWGAGRLPTEAEWEKAARYFGGRFPWGDEWPSHQQANYLESAIGDTVGTLSYSNADLNHLAGNVWEWMADWYSDTYYAKSPAADPSGPKTGQLRSVRGGAYQSAPQFLRSANRFFLDPNKGYNSVGFRCVVTETP